MLFGLYNMFSSGEWLLWPSIVKKQLNSKTGFNCCWSLCGFIALEHITSSISACVDLKARSVNKSQNSRIVNYNVNSIEEVNPGNQFSLFSWVLKAGHCQRGHVSMKKKYCSLGSSSFNKAWWVSMLGACGLLWFKQGGGWGAHSLFPHFPVQPGYKLGWWSYIDFGGFNDFFLFV